MWRYLVRVAVTTFQSGRRAIWFVTRPKALGVHAVVLTPARKLVLVRQTYAPGWRLPGGGLKRRETPEAAIVRELREELRLNSFGALYHIFNFEHRPDNRRGLAALSLVTDATYAARRSIEIDATKEFDPLDLPTTATDMTGRLVRAVIASARSPDPNAPVPQASDDGSLRLLPADPRPFQR